MCGIVGIYLKSEKFESSLGKMLSKMLVNMGSRGPDSAGFAIYKKESKWVVDGTNYSDFGKENGIFDFPFKGNCEEYSKEEFVKLRKKGIK